MTFVSKFKRSFKNFCRKNKSLEPLPKLKGSEPAKKRFLTVLLDISNKCNLKCTMCEYVSISNKKIEKIDLRDFENFAHKILPYTTFLSLGCRFEPFVNDSFFKFCNIISSYNIPSVCVTTNGQLLNEKKIQAIGNSPIKHVNISIHGANKEIYEGIMRGAKWEKLLINLKLLSDLKNANKINILHINFVMQESNIHQLLDIIDLAAEYDVDSIAALHYDFQGKLEIDKVSKRLLPEVLLKCASKKIVFSEVPWRFISIKQIAEAYHINHNKIPEIRVPDHCTNPWSFCFIEPNGQVSPCPRLKQNFGNINHIDFANIYNGELMKSLRQSLIDNLPWEDCKKCPDLRRSSSIDFTKRHEMLKMIYEKLEKEY